MGCVNNMAEIKEFKRKCNECGKMWHSLASREVQIEHAAKMGKTQSCLTACGDAQASAQYERTQHANEDLLDKLKKCPECGSSNYDEKLISHAKK
jgi:hypothetical protein